MMDALVQGDAGAGGEHQDGDHKAPEIDFLAMAVWKFFAGRPFCLFQAVQEQNLVAGIHKRMDAFRKHSRAGGKHKCTEFSYGNQKITSEDK